MGALESRRILITGSTDGLGLACARQLAGEGASLLVHGRNPAKVERVVDELGEGTRGYVADFGSLEEVGRLAEEVRRDHDALDVLVNNAGIVVMDERKLSADGYELVLAVNYLAHFKLTLELMAELRAGERSRVVSVASIGQQAIDFDNVMLDTGYDGARSYAQSKLAQIMFTFELAERLGPEARPTATALHPATLMDTNMVHGFGGKVMSTVAEGMEATTRLAVGADAEGVTGRYFDGTEEATADPQTSDPEARRRLWELSEELTGAELL